MNYGNGGRLMEDFWDGEWETLEGDFRELKALGANVVRVHLQFGRFMEGTNTANPAALLQLRRLLRLAEATGLYLDVTGLACYRKADVPSWYDALDEPGRWNAQAFFWRTIAAQCAGSPAVFCYDLMNEPLAPPDKRKPGDWYSGKPFGGYDFLQFIALDRAERKREDIAVAWIETMTRAIRETDPAKAGDTSVGSCPRRWWPNWIS
ncbi:MAG TPA: cellulase family glycosylhydrolase [Methylomirabilota bacterium]|nr:cellulase family glycosylhydrolase [Methylomirabilota bacterium]